MNIDRNRSRRPICTRTGAHTRTSTRLAMALCVAGASIVLCAPICAFAAGLGNGNDGVGNRDRTVNVHRGNSAPLNNSRADARSRNVRGTSLNNVNLDRDVHVTVEDDHRGGWDDDYHPVATAAAVTATIAVTSAIVGSIVHSVPSNCVPANYGGMIYQQCGGTWYQPQGSQYMVVNPPY